MNMEMCNSGTAMQQYGQYNPPNYLAFLSTYILSGEWGNGMAHLIINRKHKLAKLLGEVM